MLQHIEGVLEELHHVAQQFSTLLTNELHTGGLKDISPQAHSLLKQAQTLSNKRYFGQYILNTMYYLCCEHFPFLLHVYLSCMIN